MNNTEKFKTLQEIAALRSSLAKEVLTSSTKRAVKIESAIGVDELMIVGKLIAKFFKNK